MSTIEVGKILITKNSAEGVKVSHEYYNAGKKEIKYITFSYLPYNPVNDIVASTIDGKTEVSGELTGPITTKHNSYVTWENMWYNPTITRAVITKIHIQFMDNTEEMIDGKDVVFMDSKESAYYREVREPAEKRAAEKRVIDARKNELKKAYHSFMVFSCFKKMKDDDEMKFHVNQGLWLFILEIIGVFLFLVLTSDVTTILFLVILFGSIFLSAKCISGINNGKRFEIPFISNIKLIK